MYAYVLRRWKEYKATAEQIQGFVPMFLTQEQADEILATPQNEVE